MNVHEAIDSRHLAHRGVAEMLDTFAEVQVRHLLGIPDHEVIEYHQDPPERLADGTLRPYWKVGDGTPDIATLDPAEVATISHCIIARVRWPGQKPFTEAHPSRCGWCAPMKNAEGQTVPTWSDRQLLVAHAHATYFAMEVKVHLLIWNGADGGTYMRAGERDGRFTREDWANFAALDAKEQRYRVGLVSAALREGM